MLIWDWARGDGTKIAWSNDANADKDILQNSPVPLYSAQFSSISSGKNPSRYIIASGGNTVSNEAKMFHAETYNVSLV
jgi:hypothetical protein